MRKLSLLAITLFISSSLFAQKKQEVPAVYSNIKSDRTGNLYVEHEGRKIMEQTEAAAWNIDRFRAVAVGSDNGLSFDFGAGFEGKMYFGFVPYGDSKHPQPVYYGSPVLIKDGKASIDIKNKLSGKYDAIGWSKTGQGTMGYRVMTNYGKVVYDGKVSFSGKGPFNVEPSIIEGPYVNKVTYNSVTISFRTDQATNGVVKMDGRVVTEETEGFEHEITIDGLAAYTQYDYSVLSGVSALSFSVKTAPNPGARTPFSFAYASDSRGGAGGGERDVYGANQYMMKKIMALSMMRKVAFAQFSGDLIDGYLYDIGETELQYANWKRTIESFASYFPVYVSMGNHEVLGNLFKEEGMNYGWMVDKFPFETSSSEAIFARNFVLPENGPESEDGASYDPSSKTTDFPSYKENVYYYTYDNTAVIVLNSNYWYAPGVSNLKVTSGNLHAYIMDQQLTWLEYTLADLEKDQNIDHIFVTQHTPFFPNGGHLSDDMWYNGNNDPRPVIAGTPVKKGIIERRDELLDLLVNKSQKVRAILSGDEHNYAKTEVGPNTNIYPEGWDKKKLKLNRTIWQINNGAAGAPYYAQELAPWSGKVSGFTTQNAVVFFTIQGSKILMEVINPDTLEEVDRLTIN